MATYEKTDAQILSELDVQAIRAFYSCASSNVVTTPSLYQPFSFSIVNKLYWVNY